MRRTLRRSCASCAKAKHKCDLQTPRCSRCLARKSSCVYANEPLNISDSRNSAPSRLSDESSLVVRPRVKTSPPSSLSTLSVAIGRRALDPFDTYPLTSLSRSRVQGLMHHFLSKIAFEYYPLDLNAKTNPFIVSWWPLALADPALFNVSLQTASLDDELQAQKGFRDSEILMRDAVSLIRRKIDHPNLAFQDATMDAVVTLAAIEHGKGNRQQAKMHVDAVKRMVAVRGGISSIRQTSPLTARMVPWVAMLVTGSPQFGTQDDLGIGDGIGPILQWSTLSLYLTNDPGFVSPWTLELDPEVQNVVNRLRAISEQDETLDEWGISSTISTDDLHDLTCYVLHKLLTPYDGPQSSLSESVRYAVSIYMLIIHGATYYSHLELLNELTLRLQHHIGLLISSAGFHDPSSVWCVSIGMIASSGTNQSKWFVSRATEVSAALGLQDWDSVRKQLQNVLWDEHRCGVMFHQVWEQIVARNSSPVGGAVPHTIETHCGDVMK